MALTAKESAFLAKLRTTLTSTDASQQEVNDMLYTSVEAALTRSEGESTVNDVFAAMQAGLNDYKKKIDDAVRANDAERIKQDEALHHIGGDKKIALETHEQITQMANALAGSVDQPKMQAVLDEALSAGIPVDLHADQPLSIDVKYSNSFFSDVYHTQEDITVVKHIQTTEPLATKGVLNPKMRFHHPERIKGGSHTNYVVRADLNTVESQRESDTLGLIAEAWLEKNPSGYLPEVHSSVGSMVAHQLQPGHHARNLKLVEDWVRIANALPTGIWEDCDYNKFKSPKIVVGQELALPPGNDDLAPRQAYLLCSKTHNDYNATPDTLNVGAQYQVNPPLKPLVPKNVPYYYAFQSANATNGPTWMPTSPNWAAELLAQSDVDFDFSQKYYNPQLAVRIPAKREKHTSDTGPYPREGNYPGKDALSRRDDGEEKRDDTRGSTKEVGRVFNGDRTHVSEGGFIESYTDKDGKLIYPDGRMIRHDHGETTTYWNHNRALTINVFKTIVIPMFPGGGVAHSNPVDQTNLATYTGRGGLTQVNHALAQLNQIGYNAMFSDEQTMLTNAFADPRRQVWGMMKHMTTNVINDKMEAIAASASGDPAKAMTPEQLKQAATQVMVALRDQGDNPLVKQNEPYKVQLEVAQQSMREFFEKDMHIAMPANEDIAQMPRIQLHFMDRDKLEKLHNYSFNKDKFAMMQFDENGKGKVHSLASVVAEMTYGHETTITRGLEPNRFEVRIAKAGDTVQTEEQMQVTIKNAMAAITTNPDKSPNVASITEFSKFLGSDFNGQMSAGAWLHDVARNPQNYNLSKKDAETMVRTLLNNDEAAMADVLQTGGSSPIWPKFDKPYPLSKPEVFGPAIAAGIAKNPAMFQELMQRSTDIDAEKKDGDGKSDGNRHPIGMLAAYGRIKSHSGDAYEYTPAPVAALEATLDPQAAKLVDEAMFNSFYYGDNIVAQTSIQGRERAQNKYAELQRKIQSGEKVDYKQAYNDLYTSEEAHTTGSDRVAVVGIFNARPIVARDATFLTLMRHPEEFEGVKNQINALAGSTLGGKNHQLRRMLEHVQSLAEQYNAETDPAAKEDLWNSAAQEFAKYYTKGQKKEEIVSTAEAKGHHRRSAERKAHLYANAEEGLYDAMARDAKLSGIVMKTMDEDLRLVHAALEATPDATAIADQISHTHMSGSHLLTEHLNDNHAYMGPGFDKDPDQGLYFTLTRNKNGRLVRHGDANVQPDPAVVPPNELGMIVADEAKLIESCRNVGITLTMEEGKKAEKKVQNGADGQKMVIDENAAIVLTPEVKKQLGDLTSIMSDYMVQKDFHTTALHIMPPEVKIKLDAAPNAEARHQIMVDAMAPLLEREIKQPLPTLPGSNPPKQISYKELASTMLDLNIVSFEQENGKFGFLFSPQALTATRYDETEMNASAGVLRKWMVLAALPLIRIPHTTTIIHIHEVECNTCGPIPGQLERSSGGRPA